MTFHISRAILVLALSFSALVLGGCRYDNVAARYITDHQHQVNLAEWTEIAFVERAGYVCFKVRSTSGAVPGKLVTGQALVFSVPSKELAVGRRMSALDANMWHVGGVYIPGYGQVTEGTISVDRIKGSTYYLTIDSELLPSFMTGKKAFRLDQHMRSFEKPIRGCSDREFYEAHGHGKGF